MCRRFPTKEELVDAVFIERTDAYADAVAVALDDPGPWRGFVGYIETACAMQAADSGFADVLTTTFRPPPRRWSDGATPVSSTPPATPPLTPGGVSSPCWSSPSKPRPRPPARLTRP
ncbi:hypothetical protein T45_06870 [Streptomyces turgidiscabies]|nr:hypothetical protein T45_06870 [Streptomyces turgidiscabies]